MKLYSDELMEHWEHPQNFGRLSLYNVETIQRNPMCGDTIFLTVHIVDGIIKEIAFEGDSCVIARASASIFTEYVIGKEVKKLLNMTEYEFVHLQDMENIRPGCVMLVFTALQKALCQFIINTNQSL